MTFTTKYFIETQEYPDVTLGEILPLGVKYEYISSTFLNGWINYVHYVKCFLITRYSPHSENIRNLQKISGIHTKLGAAQDDIFVLGRSNSGHWWFFWFDNDTSDCCIGRFETTDSADQVISEFTKYANNMSLNLSKQYSENEGLSENIVGYPALEISVENIKGWVSF